MPKAWARAMPCSSRTNGGCYAAGLISHARRELRPRHLEIASDAELRPSGATGLIAGSYGMGGLLAASAALSAAGVGEAAQLILQFGVGTAGLATGAAVALGLQPCP